jgi:protein subunit release factor B
VARQTHRTEPIEDRLRRLGVRVSDLAESFVRSGGKGGQNVNKVATCVVLTHGPSGIVVKCQEERTQARNRARARELLADKLERRREEKHRAAAAAIAKLRLQKRRRSVAAKERILRDKKARSSTKARRGRVIDDRGEA